MPRNTTHSNQEIRPEDQSILQNLIEEIRTPNEFGQPRIEEEHIDRTGVIHVTVIWDQWEHMPKVNRSAIIRSAYTHVEGEEFAQKIILAIGLTFPEAIEGELLPYAIETNHRKDDPVTLEECKEAMLKEAATKIENSGLIALRFRTLEDAEKSKERLVKRLPGSEDIWSISLNETVYQNLKLSDFCK